MNHFMVVCSECGKIITQCRCPSENKTKTYEVCKECQEKELKKNEL